MFKELIYKLINNIKGSKNDTNDTAFHKKSKISKQTNKNLTFLGRLFFVFPFLLYPLFACSGESENTEMVENRNLTRFVEKTDEFSKKYWDLVLKTSPVFATNFGVRDYDDTLGDNSIAGDEKYLEELGKINFDSSFFDVAEMIDYIKLTDNDFDRNHILNYEILRMLIIDQIEEANHEFAKYNVLTNRSGPHLFLASLSDRLPFYNMDDYQSYVTRISQVDTYLANAKEKMKIAIEKNYTQYCESMAGYDKSISIHVVEDIKKSNFYKPFHDTPSFISSDTEKEEFNKLKTEATNIISEVIIPAFADFNKFYVEQYAPACRSKAGIINVEGGEEYYSYLINHYTTTQLNAEEVHNIGLSEVKRIREEMDKIIKKSGFEGSFKDFQNFLRTDERFYAKTPKELMAETAIISKKIDEVLPKLFKKMPMMPFTLKPIPADIAEKTTTAYYEPPSGDGKRAGVYRVNLSKLDTRPLYEIMALSLHEAVPGHHFQIALSQELDLPPHRRFAGFTAFVEGWALYAEYLGQISGLYEDDLYSEFGKLSYEMWRACRLVVDTGIHQFDWSREDAIEFMKENTALSVHNITSEVDRYITWPGQALGYKIGELKIKELRKYSEEKLGDNFDQREFHEEVLKNGAIPLLTLEKNIYLWVDEKLDSMNS